MCRVGQPSTVLACACVVLFLSIGARQGFGLFLPPVTQDLGIGREAFAFGVAVQYLVWGAVGPVCGFLADRYGAGRTLVAGGTLYCLGFALAGLAQDAIGFSLGAGLLMGAGLGGASFGVVHGVVANAIPADRRGAALGVVGAATALGQLLLLFYTQATIEAWGWRSAMLAHSVLVVPIILAAYGLRSAPRDKSRHGGSLHAILEVMQTRNFWLLCAGFSFSGLHVMLTMTHLPAFVQDMSFDSRTAVAALVAVSLSSFAGSWLFGRLADRYPKGRLLALLYAARAVFALVILLLPHAAWAIVLYFAALGFVWMSTIPVASALTAELFGTRFMASIFSVVFFAHQVGGFIGTWLGGRVYDALGSYDLMWWLVAALCSVGVAMAWSIRTDLHR